MKFNRVKVLCSVLFLTACIVVSPYITVCGNATQGTAVLIGPVANGEVLTTPFSNFSAAVHAPVVIGHTLLVVSPMTCNTLNIPSNVGLHITMYGTVSVSSGKNLAVNGPFVAGLYTVFPGSGTVSGLNKAYPEYWGAVGNSNGTTGSGNDDYTPLQAAVYAVGNNGSVELTKPFYRETSTLVFPLNSFRVKLFSHNNSGILADGDIDGIKMVSTNENYGWHTIEGIVVQGLNDYYGNHMTNNTSAGIRIDRGGGDTSNTPTAFNTVIRDVTIQGFGKGLLMQACIGVRVEGKTYIYWNQYGIYIDGGQTNINEFYGLMIRQNSVAGVWSNGTTGGSLTAANQNNFIGGHIESNGPYNGAGGIGVYLNNSYNFSFSDIYSENQTYAIKLAGGSKGNHFTRYSIHGDSSGNNDSILISGSTTWNNIFAGVMGNSFGSGLGNVFSDATGQQGNQFINCQGLQFLSANLSTIPFVTNSLGDPNYLVSPGYAGSIGLIAMPPQGFVSNIGEGTAPGTIQGIGTSSATLNADGYSEFYLGSQITGNTTITTINTFMYSRVIVIWNLQTSYSVTIAAGSLIKPKPVGTPTNVVMNGYHQMIIFWVSANGFFYEIGRNF